MCLTSAKSPDKLKKWLKKQPNVIIAWKVVSVKKSGDDSIYREYFFPPCKGGKRYNKVKENRINKKMEEIRVGLWANISRYSNSVSKYAPYYHLFLSEESARKWMGYSNCVVVKCEIKKKDITAVGMQGRYEAIVAKAFRIIK